MRTNSFVRVSNVTSELGASSVVAVVAGSDKASVGATSSNRVGHAGIVAHVGFPVGAEGNATLFIERLVATLPVSLRYIGNEDIVEVHVSNRVEVNSNSLSTDEISAVNVDVGGAGDDQKPGLGAVDN